MKSWVVACAGCLVIQMPVAAQTSFDVLEQDMKQVKQQHDDAASQLFTTFMTTLDTASQSPSQALELYKTAGGNLPDAAPVRTHYEYETPSEKAIRDAQDAANFSSVAVVIQVHCGLMHYAALFVTNPKAPGLDQQWLTWLKATGPIYPQLAGKRALKDVAVRDSVISSYLGFRAWGDKPQGNWALRDLPQLYHDRILEASRHPVTAATLDLWDTYIAMRQADEPDKQKWSQEIDPELEFDRASDDFAVEPGMEKLGALDAIIKANPSHLQLDNWIERLRTMIRTYRNGKSAVTTATALPGATPSTPSSEVTGAPTIATPGTPSSGSSISTPSATPGTPSSGSGSPTPSPTPGGSSSAAPGTNPAATPGTPSSGSTGQAPVATPSP